MKTTLSTSTKLLGCGLLVCGLAHTATSATFSSGVTGKWENPANWSGASGPTGIPNNSDIVQINGTNTNVTFDGDTWQYIVDNGLLVGPSADEYRIGRYRQGTAGGTTTVTFDYGNGNIMRGTGNFAQFVGGATGSNGTLNFNSGVAIFEGPVFALGEQPGSEGRVNLDGGTFIAGRGPNSLTIGPNGTGVFEITTGTLLTRQGGIVGPNGTFSVLGSGATEIGIGTHSTGDGFWEQNAGGVFNAGIDAGGITTTFIDSVGGATSATFDNGSILDVGFIGGFSGAGTWSVLEIENGTITDNGLAFAPTVDTSIWSFAVDNSGPNGILSVTAVPEPSAFPLLLGVAAIGFTALRRRRV
jgi:hypothetical protein